MGRSRERHLEYDFEAKREPSREANVIELVDGTGRRWLIMMKKRCSFSLMKSLIRSDQQSLNLKSEV